MDLTGLPAYTGYMSGGAGYVLSREALRRFIEDGLDKDLCRTDDGGVEDVEAGACLFSVGVKAMDSRDELGQGRFFPFQPVDHMEPGHTSKVQSNHVAVHRTPATLAHRPPFDTHGTFFVTPIDCTMGISPWVEQYKQTFDGVIVSQWSDCLCRVGGTRSTSSTRKRTCWTAALTRQSLSTTSTNSTCMRWSILFIT